MSDRLAGASRCGAIRARPGRTDDVRRECATSKRVLNAYYPTVTDTRMTPARRRLLRAASAWRYHAGRTRARSS